MLLVERFQILHTKGSKVSDMKLNVITILVLSLPYIKVPSASNNSFQQKTRRCSYTPAPYFQI